MEEGRRQTSKRYLNSLAAALWSNRRRGKTDVGRLNKSNLPGGVRHAAYCGREEVGNSRSASCTIPRELRIASRRGAIFTCACVDNNALLLRTHVTHVTHVTTAIKGPA